MEVRERSPVPPLDVLRVYVAAEAGCDGVAVLDRMCARVREADRDRFRVEPGRIENYTIGKGSLAQQESHKVSQSFSYKGSHTWFILRARS